MSARSPSIEEHLGIRRPLVHDARVNVAASAPAQGTSLARTLAATFVLMMLGLVVVRNAPEVIGGRSFSGHALDQMQNRGLMPSVVENAIQTGTQFAGKTPGTVGYFDPVNKIRVILNSETGNVVTVIPGGP